MIIGCLATIGGAAPGFAATVATPSKPGLILYRGYKIDASAIAAGADLDHVEKAVKIQIDMVERVGLNAPTLAFFKSIPLKVEPHLKGFLGTYKDGRINLAPWQIDGHDPTLLHEYLHAYHVAKIPGGYENTGIIDAFKDAVSQSRYEGLGNAYFLTNNREFFAVTGTIYLYGSQPYNRPYSRSAIRIAQPGYFKYLGTLFGPR